MTPFGCRVMRTSRAVMCVSTETQKNVTNHRGQSQNNLASNGHVPHAYRLVKNGRLTVVCEAFAAVTELIVAGEGSLCRTCYLMALNIQKATEPGRALCGTRLLLLARSFQARNE